MSLHAPRNMVKNTGERYMLVQTVINTRKATTVGGIDIGSCNKSADAYNFCRTF